MALTQMVHSPGVARIITMVPIGQFMHNWSSSQLELFFMVPSLFEALYFYCIFLPIFISTCFGCSKEPSHRDSSFEYPQHMFRLINKKIVFLVGILN